MKKLIYDMDIQQKHTLLMEAYRDTTFQEDLEAKCAIIKAKIKAHAESIAKITPRIDNVFSVEARVKKDYSFEEKLYRKNYIRDWEIPESKEEIQRFIRITLTDVIGIRVNCYFYEFEIQLYNDFLNNFNDPELSFQHENTKQKNGHDIYKFSGLYKGEYHFEVQIKSVIHNVWGETEHKNVYKNISYDGYVVEKGKIAESLYHILQSSDKQLLSLFDMEESEAQLIRSLFFCYTKEAIAHECKTNVLAIHYTNYFRAFGDVEIIKPFVICKLSGSAYIRTKVSVDNSLNWLRDKLLSEFPYFYLYTIFQIDSIIHEHDSFDTFLLYFLESVFHQEKEDIDKEFEEGGLSEEQEEQSEEAPDIKYMEVINGILGECRLSTKKKEADGN